jgi:hypothetical protein
LFNPFKYNMYNVRLFNRFDSTSHSLSPALQAGIMLNGTTVDNIVVGGAAWLSGNQIKRGDIVIEVLRTPACSLRSRAMGTPLHECGPLQ